MIFVALFFLAIGIGIGFYWGKDAGKTYLERKIVRHVIDSPEYGNQIVDAVRTSLKRVK